MNQLIWGVKEWRWHSLFCRYDTDQDDDTVDQDWSRVDQRYEHSLTVEVLEFQKFLVILRHPCIDLLCSSDTSHCLLRNVILFLRKPLIKTHGIWRKVSLESWSVFWWARLGGSSGHGRQSRLAGKAPTSQSGTNVTTFSSIYVTYVSQELVNTVNLFGVDCIFG